MQTAITQTAMACFLAFFDTAFSFEMRDRGLWRRGTPLPQVTNGGGQSNQATSKGPTRAVVCGTFVGNASQKLCSGEEWSPRPLGETQSKLSMTDGYIPEATDQIGYCIHQLLKSRYPSLTLLLTDLLPRSGTIGSPRKASVSRLLRRNVKLS
jgi:hypothetical protein